MGMYKKNQEPYVPGFDALLQIQISDDSYISSLIQTVLSVPELHRISCQWQVADFHRRLGLSPDPEEFFPVNI